MPKYVFLLLILAQPALGAAQRVQGRVVDASTEKAVPHVDVRLENAEGVVARAVSDSVGRFLLKAGTGAGRYRVTTAHLGFAPTTSEVELNVEDQLEVVLRLTVQPTELPPLVVIARSRAPDAALERLGFYDRKAGKFGAFFGPEDIEKRRAHLTSDIFRSVSGVRVIALGMRGNDIRMTRGEDPNCPPRIIIDGVIVRRGGRQSGAGEQPLDALIQPSELRGIEIYRSPSEVPPQYQGNDVTCGVVVIWSQRGSARR